MLVSSGKLDLEAVNLLKFSPNVPGFYGKEAITSLVETIEGDDAIKMFTDVTKTFEKPVLMQVYHPECSHC